MGEKMQHLTHSYLVPSTGIVDLWTIDFFSYIYTFFSKYLHHIHSELFSSEEEKLKETESEKGIVDFEVFLPRNDLNGGDLQELTRRYDQYIELEVDNISVMILLM